MSKCKVFACPNIGVRLYLIDSETKSWLCMDCIDRFEYLVRKEGHKLAALVPAC